MMNNMSVASTIEACHPARATMSGLTSVSAYEPAMSADWDRFVTDHPQGSPFHLSKWSRAVERIFHHKQHSLCAMRDGRIVGVLPLFLVSNWVVGRCLISSPLGVYGGICAEDQEAEQALLGNVKQ